MIIRKIVGKIVGKPDEKKEKGKATETKEEKNTNNTTSPQKSLSQDSPKIPQTNVQQPANTNVQTTQTTKTTKLVAEPIHVSEPSREIKNVDQHKPEEEVNFQVAPRFRTHLQTDKNVYKPSETVYVRGYVVNAFDFSKYKAAGYSYLKPQVNIISPKGEKVLTEYLATATDSVIWMTWEIPADTPGGDYTFEISYPGNLGFAFAQRTINVRAFRPPRLKTHLEFLKKGYGAGDIAQAKLDVERAEGGFPYGARVEAIARIDGSEVFRKDLSLNAQGKCIVSFDLPKQIATGVGTLSCVITDGGVVETASKTIPIVLQSIDIDIYPEGGDLVANVQNGLYIAAFTPVGDPADITAEIS